MRDGVLNSARGAVELTRIVAGRGDAVSRESEGRTDLVVQLTAQHPSLLIPPRDDGEPRPAHFVAQAVGGHGGCKRTGCRAERCPVARGEARLTPPERDVDVTDGLAVERQVDCRAPAARTTRLTADGGGVLGMDRDAGEAEPLGEFGGDPRPEFLR